MGTDGNDLGQPPEDGGNQPDPELSRRQKAKDDEIVQLREANAKLTRDNIMRDAGIDLSTPLGTVFANGYNGDLTIEAVKEFAISAGIVKAEASTDKPEGEKPEGEQLPPADDGSTDARRLASGGASGDNGAPTDDPRLDSLKEGFRVLENAGSRDSAMGAAFDVLANAGYNGDERAVWRPGKEGDPRRPVDSSW